MISQIGRETPPDWLRRTPVMTTQTDAAVRRLWGGEFQATTLLTNDGPRCIIDQQDGCNCLVDENDSHHGNGVVLNPPAGGGRIAMLFENLMYVASAYTVTARDDMPYPYAGAAGHRSMWWVNVVEDTEPGWYTWDGVASRNITNPPVADGAQVMITDANSVARASGRMMTVTRTGWSGDLMGTVIGDPIHNDDDAELREIQVRGWVSLAPEHQAPPTPEEWVDPMSEMTHVDKIAHLNTRFHALVTGAREMAIEEDWCDNYNSASESIGIAEQDYIRERAEPTTFELRLALTYNISASNLDDILVDQFDGSHNVRDGVDVTSYVEVTVTQSESGDFDEDAHDIDDVLESAGYTGYDEYNIENERQI